MEAIIPNILKAFLSNIKLLPSENLSEFYSGVNVFYEFHIDFYHFTVVT